VSAAELAALDRLHAGFREVVVARAMLEVEAGEAAKAFANFGAEWQVGELRDALQDWDVLAAYEEDQ
jgi:hypothetical protein